MALSDEPISKSALHDWVEEETRALDMVASWEVLCDVYRGLGFTDSISDSMRMEEFKWIIAEMNRHLARARKKLLSCQTPEAAMEALAAMFSPTGMNVTNRADLTYHKLRQMWVSGMISKLEMIIQMAREEIEDGFGE